MGMLAWRRNANLADFLLGGRSLGPWLTAFGAEAADMSGWLLMGLPGLAYAAGFQSVWLALGLLIGTYCNWRWVARPLRHETERLGDVLTLPEYFARRYPGETRLPRLLAAIFILLFLTFYASSGFVAAGRLLETLFGLPYPLAVALGAAALLLYSFCGGLLAASWADMLNGVLVLLALVLTASVSLYLNGGFDGVVNSLEAFNPALLSPWLTADGDSLGWMGILSLLAWGLGYPGQPQILAHFMGVRREQDIALSTKVAMFWLVLVLAAAIIVGYTGIGVLDRPLRGVEVENVFIYLSLQTFPPLLAALCLSGVLAAVLGSTASKMLVAASAFSEDIYHGVLRREGQPSRLLWISRAALILLALAAYVLALNPRNTVLALVAHSWAGFGAAFGPPLLFSLYWQATTRAGVLAGMAAGGATVLLWGFMRDGWFDLYELLPGFILSSLAVFVVSRATRRETWQPPHAEQPLVDVLAVIPGLRLDIRYATSNNFTGRALYPVARCLLRRPVALRLAEVQKELTQMGLALKVFDGYRPWSVQKTLWEILPDDRYIADPAKGSRHNRGAAVDLTLVDAQGAELIMPTEFDEFSLKAHRNCLDLPEEAIKNRRFLEQLMARHGFTGLPTEWWHFDYQGWENFPISDIPLDNAEG